MIELAHLTSNLAANATEIDHAPDRQQQADGGIGLVDGAVGLDPERVLADAAAVAEAGAAAVVIEMTPAEIASETDRLWDAIVGNGGEESVCGWCKDKWGLSWQITPRVLTAAYTSPDRAAAKRAFDAMMGMRKIDIATIEAALRG